MSSNYAIVVDYRIEDTKARYNGIIKYNKLTKCLGAVRSLGLAKIAIRKLELKKSVSMWKATSFRIVKQKKKARHTPDFADIIREDMQELEIAALANL